MDPAVTKQNAFPPESLNEFFLNVTTQASNQRYEPTIVSRPGTKNPDRPWIVFFDNVLEQDEIEELIGFAQSVSQKKQTAPARISSASTMVEGYRRTTETSNSATPIAERVAQHIEELTSIPQTNAEYLQLVQYREGQYHHQTVNEYLHHQSERQPGVRMLALQIFLSDVEDGGETVFPNAGVAVKPKKGRALLWPLVLDEDPIKYDSRTVRKENVVHQGSKIVANTWIHQRDYKTPHKNNCQ